MSQRFRNQRQSNTVQISRNVNPLPSPLAKCSDFSLNNSGADPETLQSLQSSWLMFWRRKWASPPDAEGRWTQWRCLMGKEITRAMGGTPSFVIMSCYCFSAHCVTYYVRRFTQGSFFTFSTIPEGRYYFHFMGWGLWGKEGFSWDPKDKIRMHVCQNYLELTSSPLSQTTRKLSEWQFEDRNGSDLPGTGL